MNVPSLPALALALFPEGVLGDAEGRVILGLPRNTQPQNCHSSVRGAEPCPPSERSDAYLVYYGDDEDEEAFERSLLVHLRIRTAPPGSGGYAEECADILEVAASPAEREDLHRREYGRISALKPIRSIVRNVLFPVPTPSAGSLAAFLAAPSAAGAQPKE